MVQCTVVVIVAVVVVVVDVCYRRLQTHANVMLMSKAVQTVGGAELMNMCSKRGRWW